MDVSLNTDSGRVAPMGGIRRHGDLEKCPACGWQLDASAYRCPKCRIYFCYNCRVRVSERERQYQCANQACGCYGKLLCNACVVSVDEECKTQRRRNDATTAALVCGFVIGFASLVAGFMCPLVVIQHVSFDWFLLGCAGLGTIAIAVSSYVLRTLGWNVWGTTDRQDDVILKTTHVCCALCRRPAKLLR